MEPESLPSLIPPEADLQRPSAGEGQALYRFFAMKRYIPVYKGQSRSNCLMPLGACAHGGAMPAVALYRFMKDRCP